MSDFMIEMREWSQVFKSQNIDGLQFKEKQYYSDHDFGDSFEDEIKFGMTPWIWWDWKLSKWTPLIERESMSKEEIIKLNKTMKKIKVLFSFYASTFLMFLLLIICFIDFNLCSLVYFIGALVLMAGKIRVSIEDHISRKQALL